MNNDPITLALDEALELTFPASDPIALTPPARPASYKDEDRKASRPD
jgi:hypothetical protein